MYINYWFLGLKNNLLSKGILSKNAGPPPVSDFLHTDGMLALRASDPAYQLFEEFVFGIEGIKKAPQAGFEPTIQ